MKEAIDIIKEIAAKTDRAILFHSASGKDSIALLDLLHPYFKEIVCVFEYIVKDLQHINRYINYAIAKYDNVRFMQIPHYALFSYIKYGYMGCTQNARQKLYSLGELTEEVRNKTGIEWAFYGFKQSDGMNRRVMLRQYRRQAINDGQKKCYPLSVYKNGDILNYIHESGLVEPEKYGIGQSAGTSINDVEYLMFLRDNFPQDLQMVYEKFPMTRRLIYEKEYEEVANKRDTDNQEVADSVEPEQS